MGALSQLCHHAQGDVARTTACRYALARRAERHQWTRLNEKSDTLEHVWNTVVKEDGMEVSGQVDDPSALYDLVQGELKQLEPQAQHQSKNGWCKFAKHYYEQGAGLAHIWTKIPEPLDPQFGENEEGEPSILPRHVL